MTPPSPAVPTSGSRRPSKPVLAILGLLIFAAIAGGAFGLWYVLVGSGSPAPVNATAPIVPSGAPASAPTSLDGTWNVNATLGSIDDASASFAGYRVQEQLAGVGGNTAVGRTTKVQGSMVLKGSVVQSVEVTVDMTALKSDNSFRDNQLRTQAIETATFPTATFRLTAPLDLASLPDEGKTVSVAASGTMTLHGATRPVTIDLQAVRNGGIIAVTGSLPIVFSDWSIQKPTSFSVLSVDDHGTMELHLLFTHA